MQFAALISRGILCMSYNDSDEWLTSSLNATMVEAYSLLFAMHLKNRFDLNAEEYAVVRTLFAAYYAQKVCSNSAPKNCPPLLYRCKDIWRDVGSPNAVDDRLASVEEVRNQIAPDGVLSIKVICDILAKAGPQRMQKLISERLLYTYMSRSPTDSRAMYCAIDYPPYFVWLILQNLRNGKNPLFNLLIKFGNMKTILTKFSEELITSKLFIDKVAR